MYDFVDQPPSCLTNGGRFLLWAMRGWARAHAKGSCPAGALSRGFAGVGALTALPEIHLALSLLGKDARDTLTFPPMGCPRIGEDEAVLMALWRHAARGETSHLRATLALVAADAAVSPIADAMAAAMAELVAAGFDLSELFPVAQKEMK